MQILPSIYLHYKCKKKSQKTANSFIKKILRFFAYKISGERKIKIYFRFFVNFKNWNYELTAKAVNNSGKTF